MRLKFLLFVVLMNITVIVGVLWAQGDSVGDPYFPEAGNTGYDVQHYTLEFNVGADLITLDAVTTIEARATNELPQFNLDFVGFDVTAVTVDGAEASFSREGQELTIVPTAPITADAAFTVSISYNGTAEKYEDPGTAVTRIDPSGEGALYGGWQLWSDGYVQAMSQPNGAMAWYPCNNHPSDKATYTFRITVDEPHTTVVSGLLQEVIEVDEDTNTFVWTMDEPMSTQISSVAIGEWEPVVESTSPAGVPLRFYFAPTTAQQMRDAQLTNTGEALDFLSDLMGGYPFDAYGAATIPNWGNGTPGLEAQSLSVFPDNLDDVTDRQLAGLVVHELAHQWFGDAITNGRWDSVWLHEGFATYAEALWWEHKEGAEGYSAEIAHYVDRLTQLNQLAPLLGLTPGEAPEGQTFIFSAGAPGVDMMYLQPYHGGALTLHALRAEVGDEPFFEILRTYYQRYSGGSPTTEDFTGLAEEIAGRDLSNVWDAWLFGNVLPPLPTLQPASE
jgi:aminopeptidase N